jgi:hypothetical protein
MLRPIASKRLSLSKGRRPSTGFDVLRAEPRQCALGGLVSRNPRIYSCRAQRAALPAGGVAGGLFYKRESRCLHNAASVFFLPKSANPNHP